MWVSLVAGWMAGAAMAAQPLVSRQWMIEGVAREGLVHVPARGGTNPIPVLFAFHGHGGSMRQAARSFRYHTLWREAIVVYPQGLNTPGQLTDPEGRRAGWQSAAGGQGDRDLKFFDEMLGSLGREHKVDRGRVYATGHSKGGGFTYLLWAERGDVLAAVAPSAAVSPASLPKLRPKPVLHVAGRNDGLVKFEWQERMMIAVRRVNRTGEGEPWLGHPGCTLYPSEGGAPVVTFIHPGRHEYPAPASALVVEFFKAHPLR